MKSEFRFDNTRLSLSRCYDSTERLQSEMFAFVYIGLSMCLNVPSIPDKDVENRMI